MAAALTIQIPYVRTCRRKGVVSARSMKKTVCFFCPRAKKRTTLRNWVSLEIEILSFICLTAALVQQCCTSVSGSAAHLKGLVAILELRSA